MIWFFIIVAIIIVAAGSVWWLQHYFQTRIKDLDEKVEAIDIGALSSQIRSIEQLKLTGDSLATFGKWERAFDQLNDHDLAELQKILLDLEDQVKRFRLDRASKIAKVLEDKIETGTYVNRHIRRYSAHRESKQYCRTGHGIRIYSIGVGNRTV